MYIAKFKSLHDFGITEGDKHHQSDRAFDNILHAKLYLKKMIKKELDKAYAIVDSIKEDPLIRYLKSYEETLSNPAMSDLGKLTARNIFIGHIEALIRGDQSTREEDGFTVCNTCNEYCMLVEARHADFMADDEPFKEGEFIAENEVFNFSISGMYCRDCDKLYKISKED